MLASLFWRSAYRRWKSSTANRVPGYTILLPVPGDLPVFLDLALDVVSGQDLEHCAEILVIPDRPLTAFHRRFTDCLKERQHLPLRLVVLPPLDRLITRRLNNPGHNHFLQLKCGIDASTTTHVLLHDSDLFILDRDFLKSHYETCVANNRVIMGLSPVWDDWYRQAGYEHVVATWEMLIDVAWALTFPPHQHHAHIGVVDGKTHEFDTVLLPQCLTPPDRIARHERAWRFVHFNYVISTYRWFQRSEGRFEDANFRVLLVRLLIDACDRSGWDYEAPTADELAKGLRDPSRRVTYTKQETRKNYPEFRAKLAHLLAEGRLTDAQRQSIRQNIGPFDRAFDWRE